jgi:hypothetical protein
MAAGTAVLVLKIVSDVSGAKAGLAETDSTVGRVQGKLGGMVGPATVALGAVLAFGVGTADAASDVEQSMGAVESVFKGNADTVKAWSKSSGKDVGLAQADYAQMAAVVGSQLKGMGVPLDDVAGQTNDLIKLSADLAATYGGSTSDAITAVSALMRGERDPIEKYGVSLKAVDIEAGLMAEGIVTAAEKNRQLTAAQESGDAAAIAAAQSLTGLGEQAYAQASAQQALTLLTAKTTDAQGAFARESDTAAHAQQVAGAAATDMAAALGTALLPAVVFISEAITGLTGFVTENKDATLVIVGVIGVFAAAILAANVALKAFTLAQNAAKVAGAVWTGVQWLLNAALSANPLGLVVLAIMALVAAIVLAWNKSETFRNIVTGVFNAVLSVIKSVVDWIVGAFAKLGEVLAGPFRLMEQVARSVAGVIRTLMDGIRKAIQGVMDFINGIGRRIQKFVDDLPDLPFTQSAPVPPAPAPALRAGRAAAAVPTGLGGGSSVTLVLDREVFGRATIGSLRRFDRRNGAAQVLPRWA